MTKYRVTICQDEGFTNGMWEYGPVDLRKKFYKCHHCQKDHLVKHGLKKEKPKDES